MADEKIHLFKRTRNNLPMSFMFLDLYADHIQEFPEESAGDAIRVIYAEVYRQDLDDSDLHHIAERLVTYANQVKEKLPKTPPGMPEPRKRPTSSTKNFGDYYREAITELDTSEKLLWLADYDPGKALHMYESLDYEVVDTLLTLRQKITNEDARLQYEACLFGFGGKYGNSSKSRHDEGDVTVTDLRGKSAAEMQAFMASKAQRR